MTEIPRTLIVSGQLASWEVVLTSRSTIAVAAHAYSQRDGAYVFSVLMDGSPPFEVDVAVIPETIVDRIRGG